MILNHNNMGTKPATRDEQLKVHTLKGYGATPKEISNALRMPIKKVYCLQQLPVTLYIKTVSQILSPALSVIKLPILSILEQKLVVCHTKK